MNPYPPIHVNCKCVFVLKNNWDDSPEPTAAERLIDLADVIGRPKGKLFVPGENDEWTGMHLARVALAMKFRDKGKGISFKAIVEGWSMEDVNREVF